MRMIMGTCIKLVDLLDYGVLVPHLDWVMATQCSFWGPDGKWDWTVDANQRWVLLEARKRGACIFEAFSNSPPFWMTNTGRASGAQFAWLGTSPCFQIYFSKCLMSEERQCFVKILSARQISALSSPGPHPSPE